MAEAAPWKSWLKLLRRRNGDRVREELEELIEEREEDEEPIDPHERTLIGNILKLHELVADDVMVQRVDIVGLEIDTPSEEVVRLFVDQGHSRFPVYRETLDDIVGMVHVKDILPHVADP